MPGHKPAQPAACPYAQPTSSPMLGHLHAVFPTPNVPWGPVLLGVPSIPLPSPDLRGYVNVTFHFSTQLPRINAIKPMQQYYPMSWKQKFTGESGKALPSGKHHQRHLLPLRLPASSAPHTTLLLQPWDPARSKHCHQRTHISPSAISPPPAKNSAKKQ